MDNSNCHECERPDEADNLVQCDNCNKWFHFSCANVDENVTNLDWKCKYCIESNDKISIANTSTSIRAAQLDLELQQLEEENRIQKQYIKKKYEILNAQLAESDDNRSVKSKHSQTKSINKVQDWMARDQTIEASSKNAIATVSTSIINQANTNTTPKKNHFIITANTESFSHQQNIENIGNKISQSNEKPPELCQETSNFTFRNKLKLNSPRQQENLSLRESNGSTKVSLGLTKEQLLARQVISKELPHFSGDPEDWPMFISNFNNSTATCGYSDAENLMRLQRCLKGNALEAVRSSLLIPSSVPKVMSTLKTLYGRPEIIIHTMINKIYNIPAPKTEKLETLIKFGMAVQNLCDHLIAAGQENHLSNPLLLQELVGKLPANVKLDWALYKKRCKGCNLRTFGDYMSQIVSAASEVTIFIDSSTNKEKHWSQKDKNSLNFHNNPEENKQLQGSRKPCSLCQQADHKIKDCEQFKKLSVEERWKYVQNRHMCRCCLNYHGKWPCKFSKQCGTDGCQARHHPLLHSAQQLKNNKRESPTPAKKPSEGINAFHNSNSSTLFRIIPVTLYGQNTSVETFAFLDDGSSLTLIEDKLASELRA